MQYLLRLSDSASQRMLVLTLEEDQAKLPAIDLIFDLVGNENPAQLIEHGIISDGQVDDLKEMQQLIFDRDEQGFFIRDGISINANGKELNPDKPMFQSFVPAERDGTRYMRLDLVVEGGAQAPTAVKQGPKSTEELIEEFGRLMFLHQIAIGFAIDVTKEFPELIDIVKYAESKGWIEVDVKNVCYKLTADGKRVHDQYIEEAQDLIKRYDIFSDVDLDQRGNARFDTGLGEDLRVPVYEYSGVDPFRARFLLGLNDGEWDKMSNWIELVDKQQWYAEIFDPIERAPSANEYGPDLMETIVEQGKAALRKSQPTQW